jgi:hypothetical protein
MGLRVSPGTDASHYPPQCSNHLRESSARGTLADIDGKKGGNVEEITLGAADEPFKMDQLPFKVSFAECSVKQGEVSAIEAFLSK